MAQGPHDPTPTRTRADNWFPWVPETPLLAHALACPHAFPVIRHAGKDWERYECIPCQWVYDTRA